jgi:hypothetical protein
MRTMSTPAPALSRLVLLGPTRAERESKIRRYRLARLTLAGPAPRPSGEAPYAHLKRVYD